MRPGEHDLEVCTEGEGCQGAGEVMIDLPISRADSEDGLGAKSFGLGEEGHHDLLGIGIDSLGLHHQVIVTTFEILFGPRRGLIGINPFHCVVHVEDAVFDYHDFKHLWSPV
jgi:hypothetical protein